MPKAAKARAASQGHGLGGDLRAYALDQLAGAVAQLGREREARHDGVHQARKSLRRARAALALAPRTLGDKGRHLDGAIAAACRGMGVLRDAQALLEALQRLAPKLPTESRDTLPEAMVLATARRDAMLAAALERDPEFARRRLRRLSQQDSLLQAVAPDLRPAGGVSADQATALGEAQDDALLLRHCARRSPFPAAIRLAIRKSARARLANVRGGGAIG